MFKFYLTVLILYLTFSISTEASSKESKFCRSHLVFTSNYCGQTTAECDPGYVIEVVEVEKGDYSTCIGCTCCDETILNAEWTEIMKRHCNGRKTCNTAEVNDEEQRAVKTIYDCTEKPEDVEMKVSIGDPVDFLIPLECSSMNFVTEIISPKNNLLCKLSSSEMTTTEKADAFKTPNGLVCRLKQFQDGDQGTYLTRDANNKTDFSGSICDFSFQLSIQGCGTPGKGINTGSPAVAGISFMSTATYTCLPGFEISNKTDLIITCQQNGMWEPVPMCTLKTTPIPIDCGNPGNGINTQNPTVTNTTYMSTATYICLPGFDIADKADLTITCQQNGTWDPVPICTQKTTQTPISVKPIRRITCQASVDDRGHLWNSSEANTTKSMSCTSGYKGQVERYCDSNGEYHHAIYNCTREAIFNIHGKLSSEEGWNSTEILDELSKIVVDNSEAMYEGDLSFIGEILNDVAENFTGGHSDTDTFYNVVDNLVAEKHSLSWGSLEKTSGNGAETILQSVDKANEKIMAAVISGKIAENVTVDGKNLYLSVRIFEDDGDDMIVFPEKSKGSMAHWATTETATIFFPRPRGNRSYVAERLAYTGILYRNASELLSSKTSGTNRRGKNTVLNSAVISFSLPKSHSGMLTDPVTIRFKANDKNGGKSVCSFLNLTKKRWETKGCWEDPHSTDPASDVITCKCNHLTNFALLMSPVGVSHVNPYHSRVLSILTTCGITLSSVCLIVNIIIYILFWRFIVSEASIIILNVCIVLLVANAVFIFGVTETSDADVCSAIVVVLHFLYLALFLLLLAVGINLTMNAMSTKKRKWGHLMCCLAYVLAGVIVGISAGSYQLEGYGNSNFCWLASDSGQIWTFIGPALAVILTNIGLIVVVMRKYLGLSVIQKKDLTEKFKAAAKALCAMMSITGVGWFFGLLSVNNETIVFQYLFVVCNSLQGVFILVFYGIMNTKVQRKLAERFTEESSCTGKASVANQSVQSSDRFLSSNV